MNRQQTYMGSSFNDGWMRDTMLMYDNFLSLLPSILDLMLVSKHSMCQCPGDFWVCLAEILMFLSLTGYMLWSFGFSLLIYDIFHKFSQISGNYHEFLNLDWFCLFVCCFYETHKALNHVTSFFLSSRETSTQLGIEPPTNPSTNHFSNLTNSFVTSGRFSRSLVQVWPSSCI